MKIWPSSTGNLIIIAQDCRYFCIKIILLRVKAEERRHVSKQKSTKHLFNIPSWCPPAVRSPVWVVSAFPLTISPQWTRLGDYPRWGCGSRSCWHHRSDMAPGQWPSGPFGGGRQKLEGLWFRLLACRASLFSRRPFWMLSPHIKRERRGGWFNRRYIKTKEGERQRGAQ